MGVYIKGMEMPKDIEPGLGIEFAGGIDGKRYVRLWHYRHGGLTEWFEAVPVPPHGRLVNAQKVEFELCESNMPQKYRDFCRRVINDENLVPTIIPGRGGRVMISQRYNEQMGNYLAKLAQAQTNIVAAEKPLTNADRIRAMSDEELARFMAHYDSVTEIGEQLAYKRWLDWLKLEGETC